MVLTAVPQLRFRFFSRTERRSLLALVEAEHGRTRVGTRADRLRLLYVRCVLPTRLTVLLTAALALAGAVSVMILPHFGAQPLSDSSTTFVALSTLWQVQAGVAAIALPVLLFVIETARADASTGGARTHEVLLRKTAVFPIFASAVVGTFVIGFGLLWQPVAALRWVFLSILFGTLSGALYAFYRAVDLTFSRVRLRDATLAVVREKMRLSVGESAINRLASNRLIRIVESEGMVFDPFNLPAGQRSAYLTVMATRSGSIRDIRVDRLQDLARTLRANRLVAPAYIGGLVTLNLRDSPPEPPKEPPKWRRLTGDRIRAGRTSLLSIKRSDFDLLDEHDLTKAVNSVIRLSDQLPTLESELGHLRDVVIDSVRAGRTRQVDDQLELYEELVREFLDSLRSWGAVYDAASAHREDTTPFHGQWAELKWVERDLREILDATLDQQHFGFVRKVTGVAYGLALHAINENEFYVYKHSLDFIRYVYVASLRLGNSKMIESAGEQISFILHELGHFKITSEIEHATSVERLRFLEECGVRVLQVLNALMKAAIDANRDADVRAFESALLGTFSRLRDHVGGDDE